MRARKLRFEYDEKPDWEPIEMFAETVAAIPDLERVVPCEFMYMGDAVHRSGHRLHLYKHRNSRCYLNIDGDGQAFRLRPRAGDDLDHRVSWYSPCPSPDYAVVSLALHLFCMPSAEYLCPKCRPLIIGAPSHL